jgi:hypothetical protein
MDENIADRMEISPGFLSENGLAPVLGGLAPVLDDRAGCGGTSRGTNFPAGKVDI